LPKYRYLITVIMPFSINRDVDKTNL